MRGFRSVGLVVALMVALVGLLATPPAAADTPLEAITAERAELTERLDVLEQHVMLFEYASCWLGLQDQRSWALDQKVNCTDQLILASGQGHFDAGEVHLQDAAGWYFFALNARADAQAAAARADQHIANEMYYPDASLEIDDGLAHVQEARDALDAASEFAYYAWTAYEHAGNTWWGGSGM